MPTSDLSKSLRVAGQFGLNDKIYFPTLELMRDLGEDDNLAYTYYDGMKAFCLETRKEYEWKEKHQWIYYPGVLETDFVYQDGTVSEGIDYSNKLFNFYECNEYSNPIIIEGPGNFNLNDFTEIGIYVFRANPTILYQNTYGESSPFYNFINIFEPAYINTLFLKVERNLDMTNYNTYGIMQTMYNYYNGEVYSRLMWSNKYGYNWFKRFNVQPDWNQTDPTKFDYIKNKPAISFTQAQSDWAITNNTLPTFIKNKPTIVSPVQSNWTETNEADLSFIRNKPTIPAAYSDTSKYIALGSWDMSTSTIFIKSLLGLITSAEIDNIRSMSLIIYMDGHGADFKSVKSMLNLTDIEIQQKNAGVEINLIITHSINPGSLSDYVSTAMNRGYLKIEFA